MNSFTMIQIGSRVYDNAQSIVGYVADINYKTNVASITPESPADEEIILCNLFNLTILGKSNSNTNGNKWFHQVKEFQVAFNHPAPDKPTPLTLERMTSRKIWEFEEGVEALHASSSNIEEFNKAVDKAIQGIEQARIKSLKEEFPQDDLSRIVAQCDAVIDGSYFQQGDFVEMGIEPDKLFDAVQNSNMSKLYDDGLPRYRESDGKILKSDNFFPPEPALQAEIERQIKLK